MSDQNSLNTFDGVSLPTCIPSLPIAAEIPRVGIEVDIPTPMPSPSHSEVSNWRVAASAQPDAAGKRSSNRRNVLGHDGALGHVARNYESDASSSRRRLGLQSSRHG